MAWLNKICCLFENLMLGKLLNCFTDLPMVAYKMVAYKKNTSMQRQSNGSKRN